MKKKKEASFSYKEETKKDKDCPTKGFANAHANKVGLQHFCK